MIGIITNRQRDQSRRPQDLLLRCARSGKGARGGGAGFPQTAIENLQADLVDQRGFFPGLVFRLGLRRFDPSQRDPGRRSSLRKQFCFQPARLGDGKGGIVAGGADALPIGEVILDLGLQPGGINVPHDNQGGAFRPVIGLIIVAYELDGGLGDNGRIAIRQRRGMGILKQEVELGFLGAKRRQVAQLQFGQHHAGFGFGGGGVKREIACDFPRETQHGIDALVIRFG